MLDTKDEDLLEVHVLFSCCSVLFFVEVSLLVFEVVLFPNFW